MKFFFIRTHAGLPAGRLLLLLGAVVSARVAEDQEQHDDEHHERAREHELHLELVPPHPLPKLPPRPVKVIRLESQILRLVHQELDLLPAVQHLLDVVHHDLLHFAHLLLL